MTSFQSFGDAAVLYAKNASIVAAIQEEFEKDVELFLDALRDEIGRIIEPLVFQENLTSGYRYWWIAPDGNNRDSHPFLWFDKRLPQIVDPGQLSLTACAPQFEGENLQKATAVSQSPEIKEYCTISTGGPWSLFEVKVTYTSENPVLSAAKPIADVLSLLHRVEKDNS